ncbi:hypothetical protein Purlil1_3746 [Purpureocillium lilacinum]|uniref:Uncharacterized protein n=1 Tax=Purpureocillium lilacinum TaxID=33203 RepID=A0ABR0C6I4_PURLI|nr:hypothetical protein Purlil1_3746 [Purpureocillium lilacinum]
MQLPSKGGVSNHETVQGKQVTACAWKCGESSAPTYTPNGKSPARNSYRYLQPPAAQDPAKLQPPTPPPVPHIARIASGSRLEVPSRFLEGKTWSRPRRSPPTVAVPKATESDRPTPPSTSPPPSSALSSPSS